MTDLVRSDRCLSVGLGSAVLTFQGADAVYCVTDRGAVLQASATEDKWSLLCPVTEGLLAMCVTVQVN